MRSRKSRVNSRTNTRYGPKRPTRARKKGSCPTGKIRYQVKLEAMIALADASRASSSARRGEKRVYRCPECHGWHLTSR